MVNYKITVKGTGQLNGPRPINKTFITDDARLAQSFVGSHRYQVIEAWLDTNYPGVQISNIRSFAANVVPFEVKNEKSSKLKDSPRTRKKEKKMAILSGLLTDTRKSARGLISKGTSNILGNISYSINPELTADNPVRTVQPDDACDEPVGIFNKIKQNTSDVFSGLESSFSDRYIHLARNSFQMKENKSGTFESISGEISKTYFTFAKSADELYVAGNARVSEFKFIAKRQLTDATASLVEFKTGISNRYEALEIKDGLLTLVSSIDSKAVILALDQVKTNDPNAKFAVSIIKQIIFRLDKQNTSMVVGESDKLRNDLNQDIFELTKSINVRNVLTLAEPFVQFVPYGATALYIISLFVQD